MVLSCWLGLNHDKTTAAIGLTGGLTLPWGALLGSQGYPSQTQRPPVGRSKESAPSWWGDGMGQHVGTHMHDLLGLSCQVVRSVWAHTEQEHPHLQRVHGQRGHVHATECASVLLLVTAS